MAGQRQRDSWYYGQGRWARPGRPSRAAANRASGGPEYGRRKAGWLSSILPLVGFGIQLIGIMILAFIGSGAASVHRD